MLFNSLKSHSFVSTPLYTYSCQASGSHTIPAIIQIEPYFHYINASLRVDKRGTYFNQNTSSVAKGQWFLMHQQLYRQLLPFLRTKQHHWSFLQENCCHHLPFWLENLYWKYHQISSLIVPALQFLLYHQW